MAGKAQTKTKELKVKKKKEKYHISIIKFIEFENGKIFNINKIIRHA